MPESVPKIRPLFDPIAKEHALARLLRRGEAPWLHHEIATRMADRLPLIRLQPSHVFNWWGLLGASAQLLEQAYPRARHIVIEPASAGCPVRRDAWWRRPLWGRSRTEIIGEADAGQHGPAGLIWANMMLHWAQDPVALMGQWRDLLADDGFVMFTCLGPGSLREIRALYQQKGWPSAHLDFVDMHDLGDMLVQSGFADPVMDQETLTLTWPDAPGLLAELRQLGANLHQQRYPALRTRRWYHELCQGLVDVSSVKGRVSLTFEIVYGHAFKAQPKAKVSAETTISFQDLKRMVRRARTTNGG